MKGKAGQGREGQDRVGQVRAGQNRAGQGSIGQDQQPKSHIQQKLQDMTSAVQAC